MYNDYLVNLSTLLQEIESVNEEGINQIMDRLVASVAEGGVIHIFGSGHSHMVAEDTFHRAGGLACINAILEEPLMELNFGRSTQMERLAGYANVILSGYDIRAEEVLIVVSNSGINPVPVEVAMEAKRRGAFVVGIISTHHAHRVPSRHTSGKTLSDIADVVLDNCCLYGDTSLERDNHKFGPTSTVAGIILIQWLIARITEELVERGIDPPVFISANTPEGENHNIELRERYRNRVRYFM